MNKNFDKKNKDRARSFKEGTEFETRVIDLARVTRVMAGGKRMRFRACVVIGDRQGRVGWAIAKGADVTLAVNKATTKAKKRVINVPIKTGTIPHQIIAKFKAAKVFLRPAKTGSGVIAGGAIRPVLELAGYQDINAKILGSHSKINNVQAVFEALTNLKEFRSS